MVYVAVCAASAQVSCRSYTGAVRGTVSVHSDRSLYRPRSASRAKCSVRTPIAGLAFGGTGLCSYRVRGVDNSCAVHSTVKSYMVIYAVNSYAYYD